MARVRTGDVGAGAAVVESRRKAESLSGFWRIPRELDIRASALARSEGMPKRVFLAKVVDAGMRRYKLDDALRNALMPAQSEEAPGA